MTSSTQDFIDSSHTNAFSVIVMKVIIIILSVSRELVFSVGLIFSILAPLLSVRLTDRDFNERCSPHLEHLFRGFFTGVWISTYSSTNFPRHRQHYHSQKITVCFFFKNRLGIFLQDPVVPFLPLHKWYRIFLLVVVVSGCRMLVLVRL